MKQVNGGGPGQESAPHSAEQSKGEFTTTSPTRKTPERTVSPLHLVKDVTDDMDNYRFYLAAEKIYAFTWHEFADKYIEESRQSILDFIERCGERWQL